MTVSTDTFVPQITILRTDYGMRYTFNSPIDHIFLPPQEVPSGSNTQNIYELSRKLKAVPGVDTIMLGLQTIDVTTRGHYCVEDAVHPHIMRILREHFGWYGYVEGSTEIHH